ncbi:MAG TPA: hypothetical protein VE177_05985 [Candidatus Binatus sp.]|nr:hypothetical protein [Candidatus Binatus sp.]
MQQERASWRPRVRYALSFYGTAGFLGGFFGARLFATLNPTVTVMTSGIHFHHFWYGLIMVIFTGWLGLALRNEKLDRSLALIFGLGVGFIGDEVGLLLTFRDYTSEYTLWFFFAAMATIIFLTMAWKFRESLERDVLNIGNGERLEHVGQFVALFSTFFFAFGNFMLGFGFAAVGIIMFLVGEEREKIPVRPIAS